MANPLGACWITRRPWEVSSWIVGLTTRPPCGTTWDSIILSLSIEVTPTRVLPLTSLITLVAGGSSAEPPADWVAIISILLPSVVRKPFLVSAVPLSSSLPVVELIKLAGMVVPLAVVPIICSPPPLVNPFDVLTMDGDEDDDDRWCPLEMVEATFRFSGSV